MLHIREFSMFFTEKLSLGTPSSAKSYDIKNIIELKIKNLFNHLQSFHQRQWLCVVDNIGL